MRIQTAPGVWADRGPGSATSSEARPLHGALVAGGYPVRPAPSKPERRQYGCPTCGGRCVRDDNGVRCSVCASWWEVAA